MHLHTTPEWPRPPIALNISDSSDPLPDKPGAPARTNRQARLALLGELADRQSKVVRRDQLRELGWTRHQVAHEIATDRWHAVAPEVIALQNAPLIHEQRLWLGICHAGPGSVLSHATTLQENGLEHWDSGRIDVLSPKGHSLERLERFFFHETRRDYSGWVHPTRSPPQLRIEEACLLAAERKRSVRAGIGLVAACVQQRLTTSDRLFTSSLTVSKLRHGHQIRLALLDIGGGAQSFAEIDIGRLCRDAGLKEPARQVFRYDAHGRRRYLDCIWELADGTTVVLEIDGSFHLEAGSWWRDMARERGVVIDVGRVLRCSTYEIRNETWLITRDLAAVGVPDKKR